MRKMTKTAVTLAAMSAMTVASASLAFAAVKEEANISAIDNTETPVDSSASGTWGGDAVKGYTFTKSDGTKLKNQWAEIDGVWYYFDGEKIARDTFKVLDDKGYFFDNSGRLATGWQKISSKMDAYGNIDIAEALYNPYLNAYTPVDKNHEYDYHDFVWCYFDEHGVAKENEWFQDPATSLWYYFDGNAMVKNVYDYVVMPDNYDAADSQDVRRYGFDENGAMLMGWNYKKADTTNNDPTVDKDGKVWYYYKSNGQMQKAGWATIDGKWYLFANLNADKKDNGYSTNGVGSADDASWYIGGYPLIVNSYVASYPSSTAEDPEYFYVNSKGELASGVTDIKNAYKVVFYPEGSNGKIDDISVAYEVLKTTKDKTISVNFSTYAAKEDIVNDRYYTMGIYDGANAQIYSFEPEKNSVNNYLYNATGVFTNLAAGGKVWNFTDPGYVRFSNSTEAVTNTIKYTYLTRNITEDEDSVAPGTVVHVATGTTQRAVPETQTIKNAIAAAETAEAEYTIALSDYNSAKNEYIAKVQAVSYNTTAVSNLGDFPTTVSVSSMEKIAVESTKKWDLAQKDVTALEEALEKAKTEGITDVVDAVSSDLAKAKTAAVSAEKEAKAANTLNEVVKATLPGKYEAEKQAYLEAKAAEENAWKKVADLQAAVGGDNYYVDDPNVNQGTNTNDFAVVGELVKNAFIGRKSDLYLADKNGDFAKNRAVLVTTTANAQPTGGTVIKGVDVFNNGYILFDGNGKALKDYETTKKSVTIGGVTYWSTGKTVKCGKASATLFVANKQYNNQY